MDLICLAQRFMSGAKASAPRAPRSPPGRLRGILSETWISGVSNGRDTYDFETEKKKHNKEKNYFLQSADLLPAGPRPPRRVPLSTPMGAGLDAQRPIVDSCWTASHGRAPGDSRAGYPKAKKRRRRCNWPRRRCCVAGQSILRRATVHQELASETFLSNFALNNCFRLKKSKDCQRFVRVCS